MQKLSAFMKRPIARIGLGILVLLILAGAAGGLYLTQTTPPQPINFPHSAHVSLGAPCLYCHPGATWGPTAGLPSTSKCWGCHQQLPASTPDLVKLADYVKNNQEIPWVPVTIMGDFVHFNHRPHIAAGIACETCHGDVGKMQVAKAPFVQNMGWCLDCHKRMRPEEFVHLSDCSLCHY
jgi:hypothetical protein